MVNRKQRRHLGSTDRTWRQLIDDQVVIETQLLGVAERRRWPRWSEYEKSVCRQRAACRRDAADAGFQLVVVVVVGDDGRKRSIQVGPRRSVRGARHPMLSPAAVGPAAAGDGRLAAVDRARGVFAPVERERVRLALVGVQRDRRSLAGRTPAPAARHFRLIPTPSPRVHSLFRPWLEFWGTQRRIQKAWLVASSGVHRRRDLGRVRWKWRLGELWAVFFENPNLH